MTVGHAVDLDGRRRRAFLSACKLANKSKGRRAFFRTPIGFLRLEWQGRWVPIWMPDPDVMFEYTDGAFRVAPQPRKRRA
jgi:hypothetical protein